MSKKATKVGIVSILFTLSAILMSTQYSNIVLAQGEGPPGEAGVTNEPESPYTPFNETAVNPNQTETATELANLAGSDQSILANDTDISNPNNTASDASGVNIREDCMSIPGNTAEDCP
jgi:hypothetical protein